MAREQAASRGPIVVDVKSASYQTNMFKTAELVLGEPMTTMPSPQNPGPPFFVVVDLPRGVSDTNSHYHPGYSFLMFPTGGYKLGSTFHPANSVMVTEPGALSGECGPAPEGSTEIGFYESTWAAVPFFVNPNDPRSAAMLQGLGERGDIFRKMSPPPPNPEAGLKLLDRAKHGIVTEGYTAFPGQLGPKGFGTVPTADDPRCYVVLVEFNPGAYMPEHRHQDWAGFTVIDGEIEIDGKPRTADVMLGFPPNTPVSLKVGNKPARGIFFFKSGKAAVAVFDNASVPGASAVQAVFGRP